MIVIAVLALPFCLYFVKSDTSLIRSDEFAQMYGRKISLIEARRDARLLGLAQMLGISDLTDALAPSSAAGGDDQRAASFIVNLTVLRHEADRLGIEPSESEIVEAVRNFQGFHSETGFDSAKYDKVEREVLPSLGFTDEQLRELASYEINLKRIKELVGSVVSMPESEAKSNYEQLYGKNFVTLVRVKTADMMKDVKVTDDDIKKYYETHKSELKTDPKRKVEFVRLALTDEQKKLKDKERIDALQKLANTVNDVSQALLDKGEFHQVAAKFNLPVETTGEFSSSAPDPKLKADPQLNAAAFKLTQQEPISDPVQASDGFAILHLVSFTEARPLSLDEAKQKITDAIKTEQARNMMMAKGRQAAETLRNGLKAGQPLQSTLQQAGGLKAEKMEPFTLADELDAQKAGQKNQSLDMMMIKNIAGGLQPGEVSEFAPGVDGGVIVLMDKRESPDPAKYQEAKAKFEDRYLKSARQYTFDEWLRDRQRAAELQFARG